MARFSYDEAERYGGQGGAGYFSLKNDKDIATVRFMYNTIDDMEGFAVHQVEVDGKKRYVNCLREYNQPIDDCPFCKARKPQLAKLFIPVYNVDEDKVQIWERGKKFFAKMSSLFSRYNPLVETEFEIERNGKAGSTQTTYEIFPSSNRDVLTLEDLPEVPDLLGTLILDKSADDMEFYVENEYFPPEGDEDEAPRRRSSRHDEAERPQRRDSGRRTPSRRSDEEF